MIGWWDPSAGVSGDMILGALLDAGVPLAAIADPVAAVLGDTVRITAEPATRHGLGATRAVVEVPVGDQPHRGLPEILARLAGAALAEPVRAAARDTFTRLAGAEAAVHRTDPSQVHFHEVGALDAIADVVGGCAGVHWLRRQRGLTRLVSGPIEAGSATGQIRAGHGRLPVPVPAVLELAQRAALPLTGRLGYEAATPTGTALLATLCDGFTAMPPLRPVATGLGAGGRDPAEAANVLRLVLGEPADPGTGESTMDSEPAVLVECNVDDLDPRLWPAALAALLAAGASDAWLSPILMKKGRPAHTLHVLCPPARLPAIRRQVFTHTSTIGLRELATVKRPLHREPAVVSVDGEPVAVKVAVLDGRVVNVSVEHDDAVRAATRLHRPVKLVLAQANAAAAGLYVD